MGIATRKLWELFEVSWLMMRQNPGGKSAYLQGYLLGFVGTVNIKDALDGTKKGTIKVKVGNKPVRTLQIDESDFGNLDTEALTSSDAAAVLDKAREDAEFNDFRFGIDDVSHRLKLEPIDEKGELDRSVRFIQVYGDLAAALHFGNCRLGEGKGCYLWASFDGDLKSVAETEEWGEDKKIENDSPTGKKVTYTIPGKRGGTQIVVTDRLASREAKQMINGGIWKIAADGSEMYEPPASDSSEPGKVDVFTFSNIMKKSDNVEGDEAFVRERMYIGGIGHMARTGGAGNWSDSEYTITFGSYMGDDDNEHASPRETDYAKDKYDSLGLDGIIETDWEK
jgi:hypothetical protein